MAPKSSRPAAPNFVEPMAALLVAELPEGPEWWYELKLDGYRAQILKDGDRVKLRSRNDKDLSSLSAETLLAATRLPAKQVVVDGELVALDAKGRPSFQALQNFRSGQKQRVVFYAFDLIQLEGQDLTKETLTQRRARLSTLIENSGLLSSDELKGSASEVTAAVQQLGLEGVIAKRRNSVYSPGDRSNDWQKVKLEQQQEFVVGGYRLASADSIDVLLVGYYEGRKLIYAAKVRAGLVPWTRREMLEVLKPHRALKCPFANLPTTGKSRFGGGVTSDEMSEMQWVRPKVVTQIRFREWTTDGRLRHAAFLGIRTDKNARDIIREVPETLDR